MKSLIVDSEAAYTCVECKKSYRYKKSLKNHILKKHPDKIDKIPLQKSINKDEIKPEIYPCMFCKKEFTSSFNLKRHISQSCEVMKKKWKNNKTETTNNTTNITNNTVNNGNVNNGNIVNNNNNINISINNFGKENKLSKEDMIEAIKDPRRIPLKYIELKHIKDEKNRNIYMENDKCDTIMVFENNSWFEKKDDDVCHLLKNEAIDDIYEYLDKNIVGNATDINNRLNYIEKSQNVLRDIKLFLYKNKLILSGSFEKHGKKPIKSQNPQ
jgi:DNA-directed RNA polymerase subunit RPC12/RpoP